MLVEDDLEEANRLLRLLEVDNRLALPVKTSSRLLITAADVLHS
jgi:heme/copper-type cytochrome/quinol oxidase subunit 2